MFEHICVMVILVICSCFDLRWKKIPLKMLIVGGICAVSSVSMRCIFGGNVLREIGGALVAVLPGTVFLVLSFLTEKKVGAGDGILLIILGLMEGLKNVSLICCVGLFLQSLVAVVLVIAKKADKQTCIPFVPFLLAAKVVLGFM